MTLKIILKGGPGSGHRGHAGRPGSVGGSASGTGGDVSMPIVGTATSGRILYYNVDRTEELPSDALSSRTGTILVSSDGKKLLFTKKETSHAELAWAAGIKGRAFDTYARFRIYRGTLYANSATFADVGSYKTDSAWDSAIEKVISRTVPTLVRAGFDSDNSLEWVILSGARIKLPLKDYM